ncbi:RNAse R [Anaerocolumna jejuensis DSM 15929]|uniref:Ribonuclease R n=1 Tax=Anaerocolumna jejuensis DSM 15929 TaxID=1121322 RepID=A0A1M6ML08_9FIRM|nr:ribonuclease R [Anaerocolumna jejuensis]SHJ84139.1 RNAse R [Anaerocolumna jejuensis DSM 15929]
MDKILLEERKKILLEFLSSTEYKPMKLKEMAGILQVPRNEKTDFREIVEALVADGKIEADNSGKYRVSDNNTKAGIFTGTQRGFGFVVIEGEDEDIFIPESSTKGALHNDKVLVSIKGEQTGKRREGEILCIIERSNTTVVGTFEKSKNYGFVVPDNTKFGKDIFIQKEHTKGAVNGHKVVVKITNFGDKSKNPEGRIIEILGHINDPGVDIKSVIAAYNLPLEFPEEVLKQVEKTEEEIGEEEIKGRKDLRDLPTVTIDGEDAKDLDDAITLSKEGDIYHLGVHIADVSHYVREDTPLDKEALNRGTSVYLVDRVIPMLPHKLSNGICSLNAGTDRLALSCLMDIDDKGNVIGHEIVEAVICVNRRMTYTSVKKILEDKDEAEMKEYEELVPIFLLMEELAEILREKRRKRGSIDFDFPESKVILNKEGHPVDIKPYDRNKATKLIEDFMLIANETVAEDYFWQEIPFVYRVHENPDSDRIKELGIFINNFGYSIRIGQEDIHPKELQKLLRKIEGSSEEALISRLTLRSMKRAKYAAESDGHFGLAAKYYCHFTSPIRRYPDLQIHRIIKENLKGGLGEKRFNHYHKILPDVARQASITERRADDAERDVLKLKKVEYMSDHIGEEFDGVISGITSWGMYVELPNTVEGLVRVADMEDDFYVYEEEKYAMTGEHTRKSYKLGQKVKVEVVDTDKWQKVIDFRLIEE